MSVSRKVLRKMKKVMGVIGAIPVLTACSSKISCAVEKIWVDNQNGNNVTYVVRDDKTLVVSGSGNITASGLQGGIGDDKVAVTDLQISGRISSIGEVAFAGFSALERVRIFSPITCVGKGAFLGLPELSEVNMPSVKRVDEDAFFGCESLKVVIMNSVRTVGRGAFFGCKSLKKVDMSAAMMIGARAFGACSSLKKVVMPCIRVISESAFSLCISLEEVVLGDKEGGVWNQKNICKFLSSCGAVRDFNSKREKEGGQGFTLTNLYNFSDTLSEYMKDSIQLESGAFKDCAKLRQITIGGRRVNIAGDALDGCPGIFPKFGGRALKRIIIGRARSILIK